MKFFGLFEIKWLDNEKCSCGRKAVYLDKCISCIQLEYYNKGYNKADRESRDYIQRWSRAYYNKGVEDGIAAHREKTTQSLSKDMVNHLIVLCHPDKHNGSRLANEVTKWLLSIRGK